MAGIEAKGMDSSQWELDHEFETRDGERITCDQADCTIGSYVIESDGSDTCYAPACATCEFTAGLGDVFNPDEPRFEPGAPECFKRAAALVLTLRPHSPLETAIRIGRPDTAAMIDAYASDAPIQS